MTNPHGVNPGDAYDGISVCVCIVLAGLVLLAEAMW